MVPPAAAMAVAMVARLFAVVALAMMRLLLVFAAVVTTGIAAGVAVVLAGLLLRLVTGFALFGSSGTALLAGAGALRCYALLLFYSFLLGCRDRLRAR